MSTRTTDRPLFAGFVPGTAVARLASVLVVAGLTLLYGQRHGFGWLACAGAAAMLAAFIAGALYNPLRIGLGGQAISPDDPRLSRGASWAGGATGLILSAMAAALLQWDLSGRDAALDVLATAVLALNLAYLPAKSACLLHGCCKAAPNATGWVTWLPGDLRSLELLGTGITLAVMLLVSASTAAVVLSGVAGHLAVRLTAISQRGFRLDLARLSDDPGCELPGLAALAALAMLIA